LIYTVHLYIEDDHDSKVFTSHQIKLYPDEYRFYFLKNSLNSILPKSEIEYFKTEGLFLQTATKSYQFDEPIHINKSKCNIVLFIKKPIFSKITKLFITFYGKNQNEIMSKEKNLLKEIFWTEKEIEIKLDIKDSIILNKVNIGFSGFLIKNKIEISYGGNEASFISFIFK
jgi:hypothetical protein